MDQKADSKPMTDLNLPEKPEPLPISYSVIYRALESMFPAYYLTIVAAIKKIIVIKDKMPGFSTMGITATGILIIDEEFWNTHMVDYNKLRTVLFHELLHNVSGDVFNLKTPEDTPDFELENMADLLAMDSRINAYICNLRPDINPEEFLISFYNDEMIQKDPIHKILRPGSQFDPGDETKFLKKEYSKFYNTDEFCSHHDYAASILEWLKKNNKGGKGKGKKLTVKLLGGHGEGGKEITEDDLKDVESIEIDLSGLTKEQLEKMKQEAKERANAPKETGEEPTPGEQIQQAVMDHLAQHSQGAGKSDKLMSYILKDALNITEKFDLDRFKKMAFNNIFHNVRTQAKVKVGTWSTAPFVPVRPSTSDTILLAAGIMPVLYKHYRYTHKIDKNLLPIYLDVSGSTTPYLPEIIKLIANVSNQLDFVWGFSNKIAKHTMEDLQNNKINTTGGTDFDCVIDHAMSQNFEHIVVITDGDASTRFNTKIDSLKSVVTILFGYANKRNFFTEVYENTHSIDEVKI